MRSVWHVANTMGASRCQVTRTGILTAGRGAPQHMPTSRSCCFVAHAWRCFCSMVLFACCMLLPFRNSASLTLLCDRVVHTNAGPRRTQTETCMAIHSHAHKKFPGNACRCSTPSPSDSRRCVGCMCSCWFANNVKRAWHVYTTSSRASLG